MEHQMYRAESVQKAEGKGTSSGLGNDFIRSEHFLTWLFGWPGSVEEFCFNENFVSDVELQGQNVELVSGLLVTLLHGKDLLLEFLMECFQVCDKSLGMGGGEVLVRADGYARVVAFISIKWRNSSCLTW